MSEIERLAKSTPYKRVFAVNSGGLAPTPKEKAFHRQYGWSHTFKIYCKDKMVSESVAYKFTIGKVLYELSMLLAEQELAKEQMEAAQAKRQIYN